MEPKIIMGIKTALLILLVLQTMSAQTQQDDHPPRIGVIYGVVVGRDGQPAPNLRLAAFPDGVAIAGILPATKTDSVGRYRFEKLPLGRYIVYPHDEEAGYPEYSSSFYSGNTEFPKVALTQESPETELRLDLPSKAGFLQIHLTNRSTGGDIRTMRVKLVLADNPNRLISTSCYSNKVLLLPPGQAVLVHLTSDGFGAWDQRFRLHSEDRITLDVQLDPLQE